MTLLTPKPSRPDPIPPGTEACDCCSGVGYATPRAIDNRAGLTTISYRVGTYTAFRSSLHASLSGENTRAASDAGPAAGDLARLKTRDAGDFTIGLIDAFACAADVLTFYQERIANESYLGTARERVSLQEMGRLIGYRLRPGVAAETLLAFTFETPPSPPAGARPEPGMFVTGVPAEVQVAAGLAVRSVPGPNEQPQVFETVESIAARPEWNAMQPWMNRVAQPVRGDTFAYLQGVATRLRAGDAVLFVGAQYVANRNSDQWELRILDSVMPEVAHDRTRVAWRRPLAHFDPGEAAAPNVYALRRRASVYGHNAPAWPSMPAAFRVDYEKAFPREREPSRVRARSIAPGTRDTPGALGDGVVGDPGGFGGVTTSKPNDWPRFRISPIAGSVDLDAVHAEIPAGSFVVLAKGAFNYATEPPPANMAVALFTVGEVSEVARNEFALSGKVSRLALRGPLSRFDVVRSASVSGRSDELELAGSGYAQFRDEVRGTTVFGEAEGLELAHYPVTDAVAGMTIPANVAPDGLQKGRRLIVRGTRVRDGAAVVHSARLLRAEPAGSGRALLHIEPPLQAALTRDSVVVHANVALAVHGETVSQILGAGNAATPFQRFELKQLPLTWRGAATELGAAAELTVRVDGVAWTRRDTLYGAGPLDQTYTLIDDEKGRLFVQFGDGARGARPSSGQNNVRTTYRKALGAAGNVAAESLTQPTVRPLGLKGVSNPLPAAGGTDGEHEAQARANIPLVTRTLGRAISVLDYEDFARAFSGVAKARAQVLHLPGGPAVAITIAGPANTVIAPDSPIWINLAAALTANGDPHVRVRLLPHRPATFRVGIKLKCDAAYEAAAVLPAVEAAVRERFSFDACALGAPVQQSGMIAVVQGVPGVIAVDLDELYGGTEPASQTVRSSQVRLLAGRMCVHGGIPLGDEILTLDPSPFDRLEEMT
jgi:hypothetical protein